jgi:hypothetical protein
MNENSDRETYSAARVRALESLLIEKGIITGETVDKVIEFLGPKLLQRHGLTQHLSNAC